MAHTDQQTGARSASVLEAGAVTARTGAARKDNIAANHRRQAAAVSGIPEMAADAASLRAQAARASADAGARRGIGAAFSQAAANHRSN
jgi:hypothetical protein